MTIFTNSAQVQIRIDELFFDLNNLYPKIIRYDLSEDVAALVEVSESSEEVEPHLPELEELIRLLYFKSEVEDANTEWRENLPIIHESNQESYLKEFLSDLGHKPSSILVIDWNQTVENFFSDGYRRIELDGEAYFVLVN